MKLNRQSVRCLISVLMHLVFRVMVLLGNEMLSSPNANCYNYSVIVPHIQPLSEPHTDSAPCEDEKFPLHICSTEIHFEGVVNEYMFHG